MEKFDTYVARRDRWLLTTFTLCLFLTGLGLALSPHFGWFFKAEPIDGGTRVLMGAGHLVVLDGTCVYAVVTGRRASIAAAEIAEICMLIAIALLSIVQYSVLLLPHAVVPGLGAVLAVFTASVLYGRWCDANKPVDASSDTR